MRFLKNRNPLPPAGPGLGDFWATVHVKFATPAQDATDPSSTPSQGYYRNFGIRAAPDRVPKLMQGAVTDGLIAWDETEWQLVDAATLERAIRKRIEPIAGEGIWYKGGRILYADPDLEPRPS